MSDRRTHRGPHPEDAALFAPEAWPRLREATADLVWLLSRGYAGESSLKLVGDRYALLARQRLAVGRASCARAAAEARRGCQVEAARLAGQTLWLDGYNVLTTVEAALSGGVLFRCVDGCYRDMASMHGSFRKEEETGPALELLGQMLAHLGVAAACWWLDAPVSNSGRLKVVLRDLAAARGWRWQVELVPNPDPLLARSDHIVATADSAILAAGPAWFNLARVTVETHAPAAYVVPLDPLSL